MKLVHHDKEKTSHAGTDHRAYAGFMLLINNQLRNTKRGHKS